MTQTTWDRLGRARHVSEPSRGQRDLSYDAFGEPEKTLVAAGTQNELRTHLFDKLGRLKALQTRDGSTTTTYEWDLTPTGQGALGSSLSPDGIAKRLDYDSAGRLATETWTIGGKPYAITRKYDKFRRLSQLVYPTPQGNKPFTVEYDYGNNGALQYVRDVNSGNVLLHILESDDNGAPINAAGAFPRAEFGNGVISRVIEDANRPGLPAEILSRSGYNVVQDLLFAFDQKGSVRERRDTVTGYDEIFDYDELHRLERWATKGPAAAFQQRFDYSDLGT